MPCETHSNVEMSDFSNFSVRAIPEIYEWWGEALLIHNIWVVGYVTLVNTIMHSGPLAKIIMGDGGQNKVPPYPINYTFLE